MTGRDQGSFYHEKFLRGMSDLTGEIKRVPIKGHAAKATVEQVPNFYQQAPLPAAVVGGGAVGNHGTVGSTYNTDLSGLSAATAPTSLTEADVPVRSAIRGPWATDVAFAAQNQHRDELFASTQSGIVPSRLSPNGPFLAANRQITMQVATTATSNRDGRIDAQLILAYLRNQAHEQDLLKRRELRFRLQMEQRQLERQSLLAAVKHIRQQEQHRSGDLLWQLGQLQGSYGAGH
jgi:hypothetical protein